MATVTVIQPITATETNKLRVAAYCRVSSSSEDQLNSYQAQLTYYSHKFEESDTEELVDLYADEGVTGTSEDKRDEFQRLMKDCRRGKIDRIYTKSISRFARNTRDCLKNIRELKSLGITIFFEKECIDTSNVTDEMMITILGGLAQEESTSISENMKWSYRRQMQTGTINTHSAPYGYRLDNGKLTIHKEEAKLIRKIYELFLNGYGYMAICQELNKGNISKNEKKKSWEVVAIQYILTNERYIGDSLWQKSYKVSFPSRKIRNKGEQQQYYLTDTHDPIVSRDVFERVQKLISERKYSRSKEKYVYPLSKKMMCGCCRATFKRLLRNNIVYWVCRNHYIDAKNCDNKRVSESAIYGAFIKLHNKIFQNKEDILLPLSASLQKLKLRKFSGNLRVMDIHKEIAKLREQVHVLSRLKTKGFLDESKYQEQTTELNAKINRLQQELKRMTRSDEEDETLDHIEMLVEIFEKREQLMTEFETDVFESIVDSIVVKSRNELEFHLIGGLKFTEKI